MTTKQGVLSWQTLFSNKGVPRNDFEKQIEATLVSADGPLELDKKPGAIIVYDKKHHRVVRTSSSSTDVRTILTSLKKSLNGTARDFQIAVVELPSEKKTFQKILSTITGLYQKSRHYSEVGQKIYERLTGPDSRKSYVMMATIMPHVHFQTLARNKRGRLTLDRIPCAHDASGIYFIREHSPGDTVGKIVYVGKSTGRIVSTIKDHFREWKGKQNATYEHSRGETRGNWLIKIRKGYRYDVGFIIMSCPDGMKKTLFNISILNIESLFIGTFNPRDNSMKKPGLDADEQTLFSAAGDPITLELYEEPKKEESGENPPGANIDDELPF